MAKLLGSLNQLAYLALVLGFYYTQVHLPMHQVQLDARLIADNVEHHKKLYSDSNIMAIEITDQVSQNVVATFGQKIKNFMKLDEVRFVRSGEYAESDFQYLLRLVKSDQPSLKVSEESLNKVTVFYTSVHDLTQQVNVDCFGYFLWINEKSHLAFSKSYEKIYLKYHFLVKDADSKILNRRAINALKQGKLIMEDVKKSVQKVAGPEVKEVISLINYNVKNTFGPSVNSINPNSNLLKLHFESLLDYHDEELIESVPTLGLNFLIDIQQAPVTEDHRKRFLVYRNCLYLKTSLASLDNDLLRAARFLSLKVFGLDLMSEEFSKIFGHQDYGLVLRFAEQFRQRRILQTSLTLLRSLAYINNHERMAIKAEHLTPLTSAMSDYYKVLQARDFSKLMRLSNYNEMNYFDSTYMFEQYVYGLFSLILISGISPMVKLIKEEVVKTIFYCRKKSRLATEFGALTFLEFFFGRSLVAMDQADYDSDDESEKEESDYGQKTSGMMANRRPQNQMPGINRESEEDETVKLKDK